MTIRELLTEIEKVFIKSGIDCAKNEALLLVCHMLSCDRLYIYTHTDEYVDEKILLAGAALINERCKGRPLAYIIGNASFYGETITVDERVLIPRPETEVMLEDALQEAKKIQKSSIEVLDLCTGSGCIAKAFASNEQRARITASDISLKALQLAKYNAGGCERIRLCRSDLFENIPASFDIIISNPPYVAESSRSSLQTEVRDFEPELALFSGPDGLDCLRRLLPEAASHLNPCGLLFVEMSEEQTEFALDLITSSGAYSRAEIKKDLSGRPRYLKAVSGVNAAASHPRLFTMAKKI